MLKVNISKDRKKIERQIKALSYQVGIDANETDRKIHEGALKELEEKLKDFIENNGEQNI